MDTQCDISGALDVFILYKDMETLSSLYLLNNDTKNYLDQNMNMIVSFFEWKSFNDNSFGNNLFGSYANKYIEYTKEIKRNKFLKTINYKTESLKCTKWALQNYDITLLRTILTDSDFYGYCYKYRSNKYLLIMDAISLKYTTYNKEINKKINYLMNIMSPALLKLFLELNILPYEIIFLVKFIKTNNLNYISSYINYIENKLSSEDIINLIILAFKRSPYNIFSYIFDKYLSIVKFPNNFDKSKENFGDKILRLLIHYDKEILDISKKLLILFEYFSPSYISNVSYNKCLTNRNDELKILGRYLYGKINNKELFKIGIKLSNYTLITIALKKYKPTETEINLLKQLNI